MITATSSGTSSFTPVDAGTYVARCYAMIHIGHMMENIMGKEKMVNKVRLTWELPLEKKEFKQGEGEKPLSISKEYNLSMAPKAILRKDLEGWRGKAFTEEQAKSFDITKLLGVPCLLSVIHKTSAGGNVYAQINSISALPKGMICPEQVNESFELNYDDHWDQVAFDALPDFIKDKMKLSDEYRMLKEPGAANLNGKEEEPDDDLPF